MLFTGYLLWGIKICSHKNLYANVYSSFVSLQAANNECQSNREWINTLWYGGIQLGNKKAYTIDTQREDWNTYAFWWIKSASSWQSHM